MVDDSDATYHQVSVLSSRHLVVEDTGIGRADVGLETAVEKADLGPVEVQCLDISVAYARSQRGLFKSTADGTHWWLGGQSGHAW